ncbi:MAG: hypothetical protein JW709_01215 [Sedimentisphaerales bacterium]|nr:hypothetical protein [Sedimentisphaerales bacterium]
MSEKKKQRREDVSMNHQDKNNMSEFPRDLLGRLLDYRFGQLDAQQRESLEQELNTNPQARKLFAALDQTLAPLAAWPDHAAGKDLAESTMNFIRQHDQAQVMARASAALAQRRNGADSERGEGAKRFRWVMGNLRDIISVAACILLAFTLLRPSLQQQRQLAQQRECASLMGNVGKAFASYAQDNNGYLPYVERQPGSPWWYVGKQGDENVSNTRNVWLLVRGGYLPLNAFMCPGAPTYKISVYRNIDDNQRQHLKDFYGRELISYSFRLADAARRQLRLDQKSRDPLMADKNPIFFDFNPDQQKILDLSTNPELLQINSHNHAGHGQNVLYQDGSASFSPQRYLGVRLDDIFTIRDARQYRGTELPQADDDIFIAP